MARQQMKAFYRKALAYAKPSQVTAVIIAASQCKLLSSEDYTELLAGKFGTSSIDVLQSLPR